MVQCDNCYHKKVCKMFANKFLDMPLRKVINGCKHYKPTVDVAEVKHGEWQRQKNGFYFVCSICGKAAAAKGNYCHACGAKMDGGKDE